MDKFLFYGEGARVNSIVLDMKDKINKEKLLFKAICFAGGASLKMD